MVFISSVQFIFSSIIFTIKKSQMKFRVFQISDKNWHFAYEFVFYLKI